jgi:uncharacterized membrane protein
MRVFYLLIALAALLFSSCKKQNSGPEFSYIINNVHDLTVTAGSSVPLPLDVELQAGTQEPVALSVTGLPSGVTASFSAASGTPSFETVVTFNAAANAAPGDYPLKITGASASSEVKSYDFVLHVEKSNYWSLGSNIYLASSIVTTSSGGVSLMQASTTDGAMMAIQFNGNLPTVSGTYKVVSFPTAPDEVILVAVINSSITYISPGTGNKTVSVTVVNGKIRLTATNIEMSGSAGVTSLSCNISQQ